MVDAGIARKVDFDEGRFRFEHSYRHPRHFHLICKTCNRSFEFLSSDIEALIEEVATARSFTARQSVLQIHGTCEACRTGRPAAAEAGATEVLFARDALRIAIATERGGLEFYARASRLTKDARGRRVFEKLADARGQRAVPFTGRFSRGVVRRNRGASGAAPFPDAWLVEPNRPDRFDDLFPDSEAKLQAEREGRPFFPLPPSARRQ